jgi:hypothetical protein
LPSDAYCSEANTATNNALIEQAKVAAEAGHAVIVDATFLDRSMREALAAAIRSTGRRFCGVWLHAPLVLLEQRIMARTADASDATVEVLRRSAKDNPGAGDWLEVDASNAAKALEMVRQAILG